MRHTKEIPLRLRQARKRANLSQQALAELVGVSRVLITHYEAGRILPPLAVAFRLCDTLRVSVAWLVGESDTRDKKVGWR